ncbi:hypothetical protein GF362_06205 [Candidatus Dojkabacteria bacterium]|nr:hypothetical protein [Candidatus Dojkabacteria bacterium]
MELYIGQEIQIPGGTMISGGGCPGTYSTNEQGGTLTYKNRSRLKGCALFRTEDGILLNLPINQVENYEV